MSNRKIRIKYEVRGNKAVVRSMREVEGQTAKGGKAASAAATAEKSFAESLADRSAAADKALKKTEGLFAGSDRLLSIVGKVTGALGLGVVAYKAIAGVVEVFTQKQKKAKKAVAEHTRQLKIQAEQLKRMTNAQGGAIGAIGVTADRLSIKEMRDATLAWESRTRAVDNYMKTSALLANAEHELKKVIAATADELMVLQTGPGGLNIPLDKADQRRVDRIRAERMEREKVIKTLSEQAAHLEDVAIAKDNAFADVRAGVLLRLDPKGGDPNAIAPAANEGGSSKPKAPVAPNWLKEQIAFFDASVERSKQLHDALEGLRPAWERLVMTPANVQSVADILQRDLAPLMPVVDAGAMAFDRMADAVARASKEMADGRAVAGAWNSELDRMTDFGWAAAESMAGVAIDALFLGESWRKGLAEMAKAAARQAGIEALMSTARAIAAATMGNPKAAGHVKAAAAWAAAGGLAGATAAVSGAGGGGGAGRSALPAPTQRDLPRDQSADRGTSITVQMDLKSRPFATQREIEDATLRGVTEALRRNTGGAASFRRVMQ